MVNIDEMYSEEQKRVFLNILDSIIRSENEGIAIINGKQATIRLVEVKDMEEK